MLVNEYPSQTKSYSISLAHAFGGEKTSPSEFFAGNSKFARALGSNDPLTREEGINALTRFLNSKKDVSDADLMKIWKGLFYCFWHADSAPTQADLADKLSDLMADVRCLRASSPATELTARLRQCMTALLGSHHPLSLPLLHQSPRFPLARRPHVAEQYFRAGIFTLRREWFGIGASPSLVTARTGTSIFSAPLPHSIPASTVPQMEASTCAALCSPYFADPCATLPLNSCAHVQGVYHRLSIWADCAFAHINEALLGSDGWQDERTKPALQHCTVCNCRSPEDGQVPYAGEEDVQRHVQGHGEAAVGRRLRGGLLHLPVEGGGGLAAGLDGPLAHIPRLRPLCRRAAARLPWGPR